MKVKYMVVITDCVDIAANELRASIINEVGDRDDIVIEPFVPVQEFSVLDCNYAVRLMADIYPPGTLFSVIFNPQKNDRYEVTINAEKFEAVYCRRMMSQETGAWVFFPRSSFGLYELGRVRQYGAHSIGAQIGDVIRFRRIN